MNRAKAGAKAYNDTIKEYMSLEDKLELLYLDLIDYVANELGAEKMEALKSVVNTFDSKRKENPQVWTIEDEIVCVLYSYNRVKNGYESVKFFNTNTKADIAELETVVNEYYSYFYQDLDKSLSNIIDNYSKNGESLELRVKEFIAKKEAKHKELR